MRPGRAKFAAALALAMLASPSAYAKKVRIRWKAVPGATRYELEFRRGDTVAATQETSENVTGLRVILPPGRYRYRLRAYDRAERPGEWSRDLPLTVSPTKPKPSWPADGTKWTLRNVADEARLGWTDGEKPDRWRVEVVRDGKAETHFVSGRDEPAFIFAEPESGHYRWRVRGEVGGPVEPLPLGAADRALAKDSGEWKPGGWTGWSDFTLVVTPEYLRARGRLKAPGIRGPASEIVLPPGGAVELAWEQVTAAERYEVRVDFEGKKEGAWTTVDGTRHVVQLSPGDRVRWHVRGVAGEAADRVAGPEASATLVTDSVVRWPTETRFGVAAIGESFSLATETGGAGLPLIRGTSTTTAAGAALSFERWSWGRWGFYVNADYMYREPGPVAQAFGASVGASGRFVLGHAVSPWAIRGTLGVRYQDHPVLEPDDPAVPLLQTTVARRLGFLGPEFSLALERRVGTEWMTGLTLGLQFPLAAVTRDGTTGLEGVSATGNFSVTFRTEWRFSPSWDARLDAFYRKQSVGTRLAAPLNTVTTTSELSRVGAALGLGLRWD